MSNSKLPAGIALLCAAITSFILVAYTANAQEGNRWVEVKGAVWKPDAAIMAELKKQIVPAAQNAAKARGQKLRPWGEYTFQYQGMEAKNRLFIFVNAFCSSIGKANLSEAWMIVMDGGACLFSGKYDPVKKEFFDFVTNGEA